jgi:hypothetical protein
MMKSTHTFEFTLILSGVNAITAEVEDAVYQAGCDDALLGKRNGAVYLDFNRSGESFHDAMVSAIRQVESCGLNIRVIGIEPSVYVPQAEIARRLESTRESVRLLAEGKRRGGAFPPPVGGIKSRSPLWNWAFLLAQLEASSHVDPDTRRRADALMDMYLALEIRQNKDRMRNIRAILEKIGTRAVLSIDEDP